MKQYDLWLHNHLNPIETFEKWFGIIDGISETLFRRRGDKSLSISYVPEDPEAWLFIDDDTYQVIEEFLTKIELSEFPIMSKTISGDREIFDTEVHKKYEDFYSKIDA